MLDRELKKIPVDMIYAQPDGRAVDQSSVDSIASSIKEVGLISPIYVREIVKVLKGRASNVFRIVAGQHRLAAVKTLGHEHIDAYVIARDVLDIEVELIEIDENLCRADLTAAQRADSVARRARIWEALQPVPVPTQPVEANPPTSFSSKKSNGTTCPDTQPKVSKRGRVGEGRPPAFASETAALTGESKKSINRQLARANALGEDIKEVVGTSLDKGVELDALKELPVKERKALIARAKAGEKVSARPVKASPKKVTPDKKAPKTKTIFWLLLTCLEAMQNLDGAGVIEDVQASLDQTGDKAINRLGDVADGFKKLAKLAEYLDDRGYLI